MAHAQPANGGNYCYRCGEITHTEETCPVALREKTVPTSPRGERRLNESRRERKQREGEAARMREADRKRPKVGHPPQGIEY